MKSSTSKGTETREFNYREIDWELRPGGMLVQKRDVGVGSSGPMIKIKVSHGSCHYDTDVPAQSTFGDLKKVLANETGLEPKEQRLLFRGKERENDEYLHMVGVKDMSKVILFEDPASKERKLEEMKRNQGTFEAYEAVARVRAEVDKLCEKLLKLDSIEANGEAKVQRRIEVRRIQSFVDTLDNLKVRNSNPFSNSSSAVSVTTKWETFASGVGSLSAPVPIQSATKVTQDWELFD
ncbi:BAG family molecular chaperone regulator 4-like isoform X2 [Populus nigra]|uniref:BAG family molecular chaperone regulator 4-like isoform X2 n=1 Tax=Populus nigra TaxID=3691 RepID=UPI002B26C247|nr:BAG family molecular chaperone regulator 4-like isoform X2 [Populus nigra]